MLLYGAIEMMVSRVPEYFSLGLSALTEHKAASVGICMGVGVVYSCFMATAYYLVGTVFSDRRHAEIWLKGFTAAQGLLGFIYFPLALMLLCCSQWLEIFLWVGLASFVLSKIVFIWKGFRIFSLNFPHGSFFVLPLQSGNSSFDSYLLSSNMALRIFALGKSHKTAVKDRKKRWQR